MSAVILTASDFRPLRDAPAQMRGALEAVEAAIVAEYQGKVRGGRLQDRRPDEFEGIRLSLVAGDDMLSGLRIFGNPPHTRAYALFDGETRALLALMDYGVLNSIRVGATAGVAARHLAPKGARTVGLLGSGWQAPTQLSALRQAVPTLEAVRVFSPTPAHREAFARGQADALDLPVEPVDSAEAALHDADIVDLCAPGHHDVREPLFAPEWVRPGALVISMAQRQYSPAFAAQARRVAAGHDQPGATPLGAIITQQAAARQQPNETLIYALEGGTVQDLFVATWGYHWALAHGLGHPFDLSA